MRTYNLDSKRGSIQNDLNSHADCNDNLFAFFFSFYVYILTQHIRRDSIFVVSKKKKKKKNSEPNRLSNYLFSA